jgi:hypothetical protein
MEGDYSFIISWLMKCPYWIEISSTVTIANLLGCAVKDSKLAKLPVVKDVLPVFNWLQLNIFHNENKPTGMGKDKKKR